MNFATLTSRNGKKTLINLDNVTKITYEVSDTVFYFVDGTSLVVKEDFKEIKKICFSSFYDEEGESRDDDTYPDPN